ncbi:monocarboxylate transporter 13-like [Ptychodera flava]|uniref:monocarboxylate transporter 13-like n=1 Tax=Ptychodera flava TaxID=63121 RepID=UPI003969EB05
MRTQQSPKMSNTAMKNEKDEKTYPEGGYGWLTVVGCFIATFFMRGTVSSLGVLFIAFVEHYGKGSGATSWVQSMYGSLGLALGPVAAALAKRFGHRRVVMTGGILAFTSLMLGSFASNIWQLALTVGTLHGYLRDYTGAYNYSFYLASLITIGGGVFFLIGYVIDRRLKKRWKPVDSTDETDIAETVTTL